MTAIAFDKTQETFRFAAADGSPIERVVEIRRDPLTGAASRLLPDPGAPFEVPDYGEAAARTAGSGCPFCPENLDKLTPRFNPEVAASGRITRGSATVFPNLFPYTGHNGLVVLGSAHYLRLPEFAEALLVDGFLAAQDYVSRVQGQAGEPLNPAINWNYLPASGGSILHPHLHVTLSHKPSNYQRSINEHGHAFRQETGTDYLEQLCQAEQRLGERWVGELGSVRWMHAFAPRSHNDFIGVFRADRIAELRDPDWESLARGLRAIFAALTEQGLASFNMVLTESSAMPLHLRLASRIAYGQLQTSDINFFQMLHQEPLSIRQPEAVAALARKHMRAAA